MSLPHPDSCASRSLILKGRVSAFDDLSALLAAQSARLMAATPSRRPDALEAQTRELYAWALEATCEAQDELILLADDLGTGGPILGRGRTPSSDRPSQS